MSVDGDGSQALDRVWDRGSRVRRSAMWNVAQAFDDTPSAAGAQSAHRTLVLLNLVGMMARDRTDGAALGELVRISGRPKASVHRALAALLNLGFVEQDQASGKYRLGLQSRILGELAGQGSDPLIGASADSVMRLAEISEDTAFLTVRQGAFSVCVQREEGSGHIRNNALAVGDRHPLGVGAGGLAILAGLDDEEIETVLSDNTEILERRYPRLGPEALRQLIDRARTRAYALNEGMVAVGSWAIGVLVRDGAGIPRAALSVASIEQRLDPRRCEELGAAMRREAHKIHTALASGPAGRHV